MGRLFWVLLFPALVAAQEPSGEEQEGHDESGIVIDSGAGEGRIDAEVDPYDQPPVADEPNRPDPVEVGTWQPPELDEAARREMEELLRRRGESLDDASVRYRLAEFYLAHGWLPQAEAEFLSCVPLEPDSIRPWEGLLRVYAVVPENTGRIVRFVAVGGNFRREVDGGDDWIQAGERSARITNAWREIIKRRPDDVAKRREFLNHLKRERDVVAIEAEAREILARLPADADTRFDLAEAVRRHGALDEVTRKGAAADALAEARRILEENVAAAPSHAPSLLRLARILAKMEGTKAERTIADLEGRAFFSLFVRPGLMPVEYREDTARMARNLCGPSIARALWDSALAPPRADWWDFAGERPSHIQRWFYLPFPNAQPRDQVAVLDRLARRGDRDSAGILLAFLWHLEGPDAFEETAVDVRTANMRLEEAAVEATARLGAAAYPGAERFLKEAREPRHRRRAASLVRTLKDPRAVAPLCDALAWETEEASSYGIAAALEELGDARAVPTLAEAALDARRPIPRRREAAEALAAFQDARAIEAMSRLAKEPGLELVGAYGLFRLTGDEAALQKLREALRGGAEPSEVVRLLRECEGPRVETVLVQALDEAPPAAHPAVLALLRERYLESSRDRVKAYVMKQAQSPACPEELLDLLGELDGDDVATCLLGILEHADGTRWAKAARALAKTGDARGVRYFSKTRIVDQDPGRRRLADELYEIAAARRAELDRAAKKPQ